VFSSSTCWATLTAQRNVELPLVYARVPRAERRRRATEALERVGLGDRLDHRPTELSGGQQQRVSVARALVTDPDLILADEPTGNLDTASTLDVLSLFAELHEQGRTVVLITHEREVAKQAARTVLIRDGHLYHSHEEEVAGTEALATLESGAEPDPASRVPLWEHGADEPAETDRDLGGQLPHRIRGDPRPPDAVRAHHARHPHRHRRGDVDGRPRTGRAGASRQRHQRPRLQPAHRHTGSTTSSSGFRGGQGSATTLTMGDAQMLANPTIAPDVAAVAPASTSNQALAAGSQTWTSSVVGTTPTWLSVRARTVTEGRFFTEADQAAGNTVAVLGATTASELFTGNPIGQTVTVNSAQFTVIGILDTRARAPRRTSTTRWSSR
jgi:energy-coupling factor transporter ATP-binding protein EcfA2